MLRDRHRQQHRAPGVCPRGWNLEEVRGRQLHGRSGPVLETLVKRRIPSPSVCPALSSSSTEEKALWKPALPENSIPRGD